MLASGTVLRILRTSLPITSASTHLLLETPPDSEIREGKLGTFALRVLFRQNASWQGSVTWLEENREESFRSALELIWLIDSALRESAEKEGKT